MRTCLSSQLRSMSGKQGTTSLGRTEDLPRPHRGSPMGDGATAQQYIDDAERSLGALKFGESSAALIYAAMTQIMIELLKAGCHGWLGD